MIITTAKGARFNTDQPAKSNIVMVLNDKGRQVMDTLRLTGRTETVKEFMEDVSMIEVEGSFGLTQVNEDFLWQ